MGVPLLLVDEDAVLTLFGPGDVPALIDGIPHWLSRRSAQVLNELAPEFECVWCTGWKDRADEHLPYLLGLPRGWPHITFPKGGKHWKLAGIDAYAGADRPLAWIDDDHDGACRAWAAARRGPTLLVTTDPKAGLGPEHAEVLRAWALTVSSSTA
jgi:hypothetical protein